MFYLERLQYRICISYKKDEGFIFIVLVDIFSKCLYVSIEYIDELDSTVFCFALVFFIT